MKHYTHFTIGNYDVIKHNKLEYINIECAFDIETTSTYANHEKIAFMYIWMLGIGEQIVYGRSWSEFGELYHYLIEQLELRLDKRLVIYIHNLSYEFQFMRKFFDWYDVFSIDKRKPLYAITKDGIEFRDSYLLSGYSLASVAKNLQSPLEKMVGDLDYSLVRHEKTPLTKSEMNYCEYDIKIVLAYIKEQMEQYGNIAKIPLTNTGRVRRYIRNLALFVDDDGKEKRNKVSKFRKQMGDMIIEPMVYKLLKRAFIGGFTHANPYHVSQIRYDVMSMDFSSSYPAVMLSEQFPMNEFKPITIKKMSEFRHLLRTKAVLFDVEFTNIKPKDDSHDYYLSSSKCTLLTNATVYNGRVFKADCLRTTLTEIDYTIMNKCYQWDSIKFSNVHYTEKGYLPKTIIQGVLKLYQDKTTLKDVVGSEVEYMNSKGMLNSVYGMMVTDIAKPLITYCDDEWGIEPLDLIKELDKYNTNKNRFLYYAWGVWITAYARRNLWSGICELKNDYIYSDTDSVKFINYDKHENYFKWYNETIINKMKKMCSHYDIDKSLLSPKNKNGEQKLIGIWEIDGIYKRFKTLGAKRYLVETDDGLKLTVAGLSKQNGINYMIEQCNGNFDLVFEMFNDQLYIPSDKTGKNASFYIDEPKQALITDYLGESCIVKTPSGQHLEKTDFTLSIEIKTLEFLRHLKKGELLIGDFFV